MGQDRTKRAANTAECRADKLQKLQIEAKTAKFQLEEELAKARACLSLVDAGRGGGCSLDIEAAMAQVVAAGRQSLIKRRRLQPWRRKWRQWSRSRPHTAQESLAALEAAEFTQRRVVLKLKGCFFLPRRGLLAAAVHG